MKPRVSTAPAPATDRAGRRRLSMSRAGWSLVELLVAIAILAVLTGLLLPAIQAARESSRSNACRNNLKQISLGILNYESAHKHFPKGAEGRPDMFSSSNMIGLSWWADTLPYLEGGAVADQLDRAGANAGWALLNIQNGKLADNFGPEFIYCPSSSYSRFTKSGDFQIGCPQYTGIAGATNHDGFPAKRVSVACCRAAQISADGVLVSNAITRLGQIEDGLANTLLVGEQSDFAYSQEGLPMQNIGPGVGIGWMAGTSATGVPGAQDYGPASAPAWNIATVRYALNEHRYDLQGVSVNRGANNPLLSAHPGIVNLARCDGSVRAANDSMDVAVLKSLAMRDDGTAIEP